jgi:medium-chain acyl-[acyl-carrier-protein] hydrolase
MMTEKKKNIWEENHAVSWEDTTTDNHLSITALDRDMLQAAVNHAEHLGFGFSDTSKEDLSWVLFRINMQIKRLPAWKEKYTVVTWPSRVGALTAFREFEVYDEKNALLATATSEWSVINLKTRRPRRMSSLSHLYDYLTDKTGLDRPFFKLDPKIDFEELFPVTVRYSDLDMNGHANAGKYFDWLSDAIYEIYGNNRVAFISFNYFQECLLGDTVSIQKSQDDSGYIRGWKTSSGKMAFWAKVEMVNADITAKEAY